MTGIDNDGLERATGATVIDGLGLVETSTLLRARMRTKSAVITLMDCTVFCSISVQSGHLALGECGPRRRVGEKHSQTTCRTFLRLPAVDII